MKRLLSLLFLLFFINANANANEISVGSFNIEWFGHGNAPRTEEQIKKIANYIKSLEIDVLACQEINPKGDKSGNNIKDWVDLKNYLGSSFDARYGKTGRGQRLAYIWRIDRVQLSDFGELKDIRRESFDDSDKRTFPRIPYTAYVKSKVGGLDFRIITVHLYFGKDKARYMEAKVLNNWVKNYQTGQNDKDVIIIGDFNTKPMGFNESHNSKTISNLEKGNILISVSKNHYEFTTPTSRERYDHAFLSTDLMKEYICGSWDVHREKVAENATQYLHDISNHVPVSLKLKDEDNDDFTSGDFGK